MSESRLQLTFKTLIQNAVQPLFCEIMNSFVLRNDAVIDVVEVGIYEGGGVRLQEAVRVELDHRFSK